MARRLLCMTSSQMGKSQTLYYLFLKQKLLLSNKRNKQWWFTFKSHHFCSEISAILTKTCRKAESHFYPHAHDNCATLITYILFFYYSSFSCLVLWITPLPMQATIFFLRGEKPLDGCSHSPHYFLFSSTPCSIYICLMERSWK